MSFTATCHMPLRETGLSRPHAKREPIGRYFQTMKELLDFIQKEDRHQGHAHTVDPNGHGKFNVNASARRAA